MNLLSASIMSQAWERFWFRPGSAKNLAMARIVFATTSLWVLASRDFAGISALPAEFWSGIPASTRWRFLVFGGHPSLERGLQWIAAIALVCVVIGVFPRLFSLVAGLLLYHLAPLESIIWTNSPYARGLTISVLALLTLSFSRCDDCWTLLASRRRKTLHASGDYTWPIRLVQVFLVQVYFFSGYSKLFFAGWKWASGSNLRNWLLYFNEADQSRVFHSLGVWFAARPAICSAIGAATLALELGFVTVLFSSHARRVLVPIVALFHVGILLSMNLVFLNVPQLLVFADWDWLGSRSHFSTESIETHAELAGPRYETEPPPQEAR